MRLAAKIEKTKKLKSPNTYSLWVKITDVLLDTVKISGSLKGKIVKITREFPENAPEPCDGELIVLDKIETLDAIQELNKPKNIPKMRHLEVSKFLADLDGDGYDEMFLGNSFAEMIISPVRSGRIIHLSTCAGKSFFENKLLKCLRHNAVGGAFFTAGKSEDFKLDSAKFKPEKMDKNKVLCSRKKNSISMKSKISNVNTKIQIELSADSPVFRISLNLDNSSKKAKNVDVSPYFNMNFEPVGNKSSKLYFQEPSGEIFHFLQKSVYSCWDFDDSWINYTGDIETDNSGFFAIRRKDTNDGLCISFDPKTVFRVWEHRHAPLPHTKLIYSKRRIKKNSLEKFELFITPLTDFKIHDGSLLGYTLSPNGCFIVFAGNKKPNISITENEIVKDLELQKISRTMFGKYLKKSPDTIELKNSDIKLIPKNNE
ncbi:hypothetical protein J7L68_02935 [bacterium]|nr:hypothetical protein [bacterium]